MIVGALLLQKSEQDADYVPMPIVMIDQDSDSDATIVQLSFGDRLGALIDTVKCPLGDFYFLSLLDAMLYLSCVWKLKGSLCFRLERFSLLIKAFLRCHIFCC